MQKFAIKNLYDEFANLSKQDKLKMLTELSLTDDIGVVHPDVYKLIPTKEESAILDSLKPFKDTGITELELLDYVEVGDLSESLKELLQEGLVISHEMIFRSNAKRIYWSTTTLANDLLRYLIGQGFDYGENY